MLWFICILGIVVIMLFRLVVFMVVMLVVVMIEVIVGVWCSDNWLLVVMLIKGMLL